MFEVWGVVELAEFKATINIDCELSIAAEALLGPKAAIRPRRGSREVDEDECEGSGTVVVEISVCTAAMGLTPRIKTMLIDMESLINVKKTEFMFDALMTGS